MLGKSLEAPDTLAGIRFEELYEVATDLFGLGILGRKRDRDLVWARRFIAYQMLEEGYTNASIARLLSKNHASVINMYRQMTAMLEVPNSYKEEMALWGIFKERIKRKKHDETGTL
jgi:chromosomal replication initiation ATPase DnaA